MFMFYVLDWITCCCYLILRRFNYPEWDAKFTAVLNSSVIVGCISIVFTDGCLVFTNFPMLQEMYNSGSLFYISVFGLSLFLLLLRYYYFSKDIISQIEKNITIKDKYCSWKLIISFIFILISSISGCVLMGEYIKSQGIVFG